MTTTRTARTRFKCSNCGKVPTTGADPLSVCERCQGRRYCSKKCQKADKPSHSRDCNTIVLFTKTRPKEMKRIVYPRVVARDPERKNTPKPSDTIYHLNMATPWSPYEVKYLGAFIELDALRAKIHDTVDSLNSMIPSSIFLNGLLDSPSGGLGAVEELRIPLLGLEKIVRLEIELESNEYIRWCAREGKWSEEKPLYPVIIEKPRVRWNEAKGMEEHYVADVHVEETFASLMAANVHIADVVTKWKTHSKGMTAELLTESRDVSYGSLSRDGVESRRVSILTQPLSKAIGPRKSEKRKRSDSRGHPAKRARTEGG